MTVCINSQTLINAEVPTRVATQAEEILRALLLGCLTVYTFIYIWSFSISSSCVCNIVLTECNISPSLRKQKAP